MVWKKYSLKKNQDIKKTFNLGKKLLSDSLILLYKKLVQEKEIKKKKVLRCLYCISVPKNIVKKAVERNKIKREIKSTLIELIKISLCQLNSQEHPVHYAVVIKIKVAYLNFSREQNSKNITNLLHVYLNKITVNRNDKI